MTRTIRSLSGTAPLDLDVLPAPGVGYLDRVVFITHEDGSGQEYRVRDLLWALGFERTTGALARFVGPEHQHDGGPWR